MGQGIEEDRDSAEVLKHIFVSQIFMMIKIEDIMQIKMENNFHLHIWRLMQYF